MDWKTRIPALILWLALVLSSLGDVDAEQRVVCYYTNWSVYRPGTAKFSPQNINPYLCTHLIYAFGGFTKENTLKPFDKYQDIEKGGYAKFTGLKTYNKNLKTMLAIGGWNEGSSRFSPMVADPGRRKEFVKNSVKFLRQNHFDGLDLDWEYPAFRDGGKPRDRNNYADLVQELREEFERESSKTGRPRLLLSMAVPAGIEYIDKGYDIPRLNDYLDFINLLSYDYHSAFEPAVNHHAPLYPLEEDNEYNYDTELTIDYTIEHLLKSGASSEKIILGIPTYGRSYTLFNEDATEIGAPADGPGEEGDATREKGYLAYYEICENVAKSDEWEVVQPNPAAMGPYAFREKQWVGYDDEDIVRAKARYVNDKKLGGIMFWSIDNDDFRGKCHGRPYPLIEAAKEAMLAGDEKSTSGLKTKLSDNRKKTRTQGGQRIQGNTIGRKLSSGNRRTTTETSVSRRRNSASRSNARSNGRGGNNAEDEENDDEEEANSVKAVEKPRARNRSKPRSKNRLSAGGRRKHQQSSRRGEDDKDTDAANEESVSNKFTTPEPPTTPDPGSDFKCEDEGFFPHPRDCKKYFWCLDSGPSGLGIVGHQFTCPSGLVFNKAADSCDYPRNVVCPKAKTAPSTVSTTRAPITAATSRTTYLYKPPKRTTTSKPESDEEEYEYYDDEEIDDSEEVEEEPRITTSAKPLLYKTINRSRPTTTTTTSAPVTTTTETSVAASTKTYRTTSERVTSFEDEEDPRVIKELIDLIRKAGGIEQLEKQLNYQEKNSASNSGTTEVNGRSTPATISRSLYERVLNRQATRNAGGFLGSLSTTQSTNGDKSDPGVTKNSRIGFVNGPGGAQFEGLDSVPEVQSLRRTNKPKYVTIERNRSPTSESPIDDDEEIDDEVDEDNTDVASSEDQAVSDPPYQKTSNRRVTPSYVNIRRSRPSTTTSENDVEVKDEDSNAEDDDEEEEEIVARRHHVVKTEEEESSSPKSRYTNIQRFRSTTLRNTAEDQAEEVAAKNDFTTESSTTTTTTTEKEIPVTEEIEDISSSTIAQSSTISESLSSSTLEHISSSIESTTPLIHESTSDSSLKLVEDSATEILFTTAAAAASSSSAGSSLEPITRGPSIAAVSQPRPFGFPRRGRPTASTSSVAPVTEQSRIKVVSEALRLPTLKELVGYTPTQTESIPEFTSVDRSTTTFANKTINDDALRDEQMDRSVLNDNSKIIIEDPIERSNNRTDDNDSRELEGEREKEIFDNDILGSEEIQRRSSSSSFITDAQYSRSTNDRETTDPKKSVRRIKVPVRILDDANGEEVAELVILRVPESKLNSAILKPVFRVKVLERDDKSPVDGARDGVEGAQNVSETSSENELPDDRGTSSRRRRIRINSSPSSAAFGDTAKESEEPIDTENRPRNRQRIVKARRRTRIREVANNETGERSSNRSKNEEIQGNRKNAKRRERIDAKLLSVTNSTSEHSTESTTAIKATTLRGNASSPSKTPNIIRGFYVTKSSLETSSTPDVVTTDSTIESTRYPSTAIGGNYAYEQTTGKTDLAANNRETVAPLSEEISYIADESSTYESIGTTFAETESTTRINNDIYSSEETPETVTPELISTIEDGPTTESDASVPTMTEEETTEQPEATATFRPWATGDVQTTNPTISTEAATSEYFTDNSSQTILAKSDLTVENFSESSKTSENSRYEDSPKLKVKTITVSTTVPLDDISVRTTLETEKPARTTTPHDTSATYTGAVKRGRVRFTSGSKPDAIKLPSREHSSSGASTEVYDATIQQRLVETTASSRPSSLRGRDHRRRTTTSLKIDDSAVESVTGKKLISTSTEPYDKTIEYTGSTTEGKHLRTNLIETTESLDASRSSSRSSEHLRGTTKSLDTDRTAFVETSTEIYDNTVRDTSASSEAEKVSTNFVETTASDSYSDRVRKTTQSLDSYDHTNDSATGNVLTTTSTEVYDKTMERTSAPLENKELSTDFVETTRSEDSYSDDPHKTTKSSLDSDIYTIDSTIAKDFSTISNEDYVKTIQYTIATPEAKNIGTNFVETTGSYVYVRANDVRETTKSLPDSEDMTINSSTDKDWTAASTEAYDETIKYPITTPVANYASTNFAETTESHLYTGPLSEETFNVVTTTESYDKITESSESADTVNDTYNREEEIRTESAKIVESTSSDAETTGPWSYVQRNRIADSTEDYKTESINISNDVTVDIKTETFTATTEVYASTDRSESSVATETKDAERTNDRNERNRTEAIRQTTETIAHPETEPSEQLSSSISSTGTVYDKSEEPTPIISVESTTAKIIESTTGESSTYARVVNEKIATALSADKNLYSTIDSSTNTISPVTPHETKRTRGRVRFTNFAAMTDEKGVNKRPVKQVVVRRRLATDTPDRHRSVETTSATSASPIEAPKNSRYLNRQLAKEKKNLDKLHERLIEEKKHSANVTVRPTEEKKHSDNVTDRLSEEKKYSAKASGRLAARKIHSDDAGNQLDAEKIDSTKVTEQSVNEKRNGTKSMRRRVVVYRGRPRAEIVTSTTTMQSLSPSSEENSNESSRTRRRKWRKRIVVKRARTEEPDDQSIAETSDVRRAVIDDTIVDFRDLGSSVEDHELANSAERADEDTGGEVNLYKSSGAFLRRPGTLVRGDGNNRSKTKSQGNSVPITLPVGQTSVFSKIRPVGEVIKTDDQSGRAQELAVTLADPPAVRSSATTGRLQFRTTSATRKISTTIAPRTDAPTTSRTTPLVRRRQKPRDNVNSDRIVENVTTRPRRPAIIDYDYYVDDDDIRLVVKPELKDKLFVTRKGGIRCLDQGNFAHPTSCKKFITCARMVNGQVIGTEYTCPDKLSFDPVGGICNWSAGLGCEEKKA